MIFTPPPTLRRFMVDPHLARFVVGPLGSGKSTAMIIELARRMREQQPDADGIRPTRFAIIRNTLQQIRQTCLPDIREWLDPVMDYKIYESTIYFRVPLDDGSTIQSEWLMMPIDTIEDTRRLLSLQLTGAWVSEFRELPYDVVASLMGRVGRYPRTKVAPTWEGLIGESNPFSDGSDWHEHLELNLPKDWAFFRQPGGLDPDAENRDINPNTGRPKLPDFYYERLIEGHDEEWIRVHIHAKNGDDLSGQAVFKRSFIPERHVSATPLQVARNRPLIVMQDLGRTPCSLIGQIDVFGRLLIMHEITSSDYGLWRFIGDLLMPVLVGPRFAGCAVFVVMDPAGTDKSQLREENAGDIFKSYGLSVMAASTNDVVKRIQAVEGLMVGPMRGGNPGLLIDGPNCPLLQNALKHHYRYKRRKTGDIEDRPQKNHPWSDLADALQYGALSVQLDLVGRYIRQNQSGSVGSSMPVPAGAWT